MTKTNQNNKYIPNELIVDIFKATTITNTTKIKQLEEKLQKYTHTVHLKLA
uniref:Restriction endonuclease subunit M n=1 Tax=Meloidogyne hapla TaxID=6305 RepID=A0A1I8B422_MELHA